MDLPIDLQTIHSIADAISAEEGCTFQLVEIVFVDKAEIIRINKEHLKRGYVTDTISFRYDNSLENEAIEGTLYCCAPRIAEQAEEHNEPVTKEFRRVVIHGMLHLAGYGDKSDQEKKQMRRKEEFYLD